MGTLRLHTQINTLMAQALARAQQAVAELDEQGCNVHAMVIRDGRPVLLIEPPGSPWVASVQMQRNSDGKREAVWMAEVAGCRVEWQVPLHLQAVPSRAPNFPQPSASACATPSWR